MSFKLYRYIHKPKTELYPETTFVIVSGLEATTQVLKICRDVWGKSCMGTKVFSERHNNLGHYRIQIQAPKSDVFEIMKTWRSVYNR